MGATIGVIARKAGDHETGLCPVRMGEGKDRRIADLGLIDDAPGVAVPAFIGKGLGGGQGGKGKGKAHGRVSCSGGRMT